MWPGQKWTNKGELKRVRLIEHKMQIQFNFIYSDRDISPGEAVSSKKRKVTSTRRISFENSYARITGWAEHILTRLEDGVAGLELVDQQFLHEETEAEVKSQEEKVEELVRLGQELVRGKMT